MKRIGIWNITGQNPIKVKEGDIGFEKQLEAWIELRLFRALSRPACSKSPLCV